MSQTRFVLDVHSSNALVAGPAHAVVELDASLLERIKALHGALRAVRAFSIEAFSNEGVSWRLEEDEEEHCNVECCCLVVEEHYFRFTALDRHSNTSFETDYVYLSDVESLRPLLENLDERSKRLAEELRQKLSEDEAWSRVADLVHDAFASQASEINNRGLEAQVKALLQHGLTRDQLLAAV